MPSLYAHPLPLPKHFQNLLRKQPPQEPLPPAPCRPAVPVPVPVPVQRRGHDFSGLHDPQPPVHLRKGRPPLRVRLQAIVEQRCNLPPE